MNIIDNTAKMNKLGDCMVGDLVRLGNCSSIHLVVDDVHVDTMSGSTKYCRYVVDLNTGFHEWVDKECVVTLLNGELTVTNRTQKSKTVYLRAEVKYDTFTGAQALVPGKLATIKAVRAVSGWGLKESKDFVDSYVERYNTCEDTLANRAVCPEADLLLIVKTGWPFDSHWSDFFEVC